MSFRHQIGSRVIVTYGDLEYSAIILAIAIASGEVYYKVKYRRFRKPEWVLSSRVTGVDANRPGVDTAHTSSEPDDETEADEDDDLESGLALFEWQLHKIVITINESKVAPLSTINSYLNNRYYFSNIHTTFLGSYRTALSRPVFGPQHRITCKRTQHLPFYWVGTAPPSAARCTAQLHLHFY